jgi:DNA segregation ATPase FtsK/SpoIIIE, S-DNA-T family
MQITAHEADGDRDLVLVDLCPEALVCDLIEALWPRSSPAAGLIVDGAVVHPDLSLDEAGLVNGSVVEPIDSHGHSRQQGALATPGGSRRATAIEVVVSGGPGAGRRARLGESLVAGRGASVGLHIDDPTVSPRHLSLSLSGRSAVAHDLGSHNGSRIDGAPIHGPESVPDHAVIETGATSLAVRDERVDDRPLGLARAVSGAIPFNRPPRAGLTDPVGEIVVPDPPLSAERRRAASAVALIAPVVMGLVMVAWLGSVRYALFAIMSPVMFVANMIADRRRAKKESRSSQRRFRADLEAFRVELVEACRVEARRLDDLAPDLAEVMRRVQLPSMRLWERRQTDGDYLHLRVGRGALPWVPPVEAKRVRGSEALLETVERFSAIPRCAIDVDLSPSGVVGIVGDRGVALALARSLVCQAAAHHGPSDLPMTILASIENAPEWDWVKWLPHLRTGPGEPSRMVADSETSRTVMQSRVESFATAKDSELAMLDARAHPGPALFLVVDDVEVLGGRRSPVRAVLRGDAGPVAGVVLAPTIDRLPASCSNIVMLDGDLGAASLAWPHTGEAVDRLTVDGLTEGLAADCARRLSRFDDLELAGESRSFPGLVRLPPLLGTPSLDAPGVALSWSRRSGGDGLECPIGVGENGAPLALDLVADGPHALVAGTTGAGKSELLRSWVAGLASRYSPEELVFVLVDYKGGSAFDECSRLPHTVGVVTDLDEHLGERALRSLEAELVQRERRLREAGASDLSELVGRGSPGGPLPRLVVVVDEFATMAAELPDFMGSLVGVAQRGRSLGVHMILATQRPSGAVNANIKANTSLRIALRVHDSADSLDVIGAREAATISRSTPGRAWIRTGPGELVSVQTALSSAATDARRAAPMTLAPFVFGPIEPEAAASPTSNGQTTDLQAIVGACRGAFELGGFTEPRRPWLPMLPGRVDLVDLVDGSRTRVCGGEVVLGLADDPDRQVQDPAVWIPSEGHLGLLGMAGSGTTNAAVSAVLSAALTHSPDQLHVYAIDYGGGLGVLDGLPHTGAVVGAADHERQARLVAFLRAQIDHRRASAPDDVAPRPSVILVVDGCASFMADYDGMEGQETLDALRRVMLEGAAVGVHVIVTGSRPNEMAMRIMSSVTQRVMFRHADPSDFSALGLRQSALPAFVPGRGVHSVTRHVVQVATATEPRELVGEIARRTAAPTVPPVTISCMPERVTSRSLPAPRRRGDVLVLPIGIDGEALESMTIELHPGDHLFVAGPPRSGVSTSLEHLARALRAVDETVILVGVAGPSSPLASTGELFDAFGSPEALDAVLRRALDGSSRRWAVFVDDAHLIDEAAPIEALVRAGSHVRLVVGGRSDQLHGHFSHWTRAVRRSGRGLLLQPRLDADGDLLGVRLPRRLPVQFVPGRGFLVSEGRAVLVQVARPDDLTA